MNTNIQDFLELLNDEIDNKFPNTIKIIIQGGDYISDFIMELRENNYRMQYCPYEMFVNCECKYEDSILALCNAWEKLISK